MNFSFKNYSKLTPKKAVRIGAAIKAIFVAAAATSMVTNSPWASTICLILAGSVNEIVLCFADDEQPEGN